MARAKRNAEERIAESKRLLKAKAAMPHGQWLGWIKANTDYSTATTQRYVREAKAVTPEPAVDLGSACIGLFAERMGRALTLSPTHRGRYIRVQKWRTYRMTPGQTR